MDPNRSPGKVVDETCWSDYDLCKQTGNLYCCAKMVAEITAAEDAAKRGLDLAVVVPALTVGPMLQQTAKNMHVARFLTGAKPAYQNAVTAYADVRDVARAHALVYELHDPSGGLRYLCLRAQFVQLLRDLFPRYPVTAKYEDEGSGKPMVKPYKFSNQRLKDLGLGFTPIRESLYQAVLSLQHKGHLPRPSPVPKRSRL